MRHFQINDVKLNNQTINFRLSFVANVEQIQKNANIMQKELLTSL